MNNINRTIIRGNIGKVGTVRQSGSRSVVNISVATNFIMKGKDGNPIVETTWHEVVLWQSYSIPEFSLLKTGAPIQVEGRYRQRQYTASDGSVRYAWELLADDAVLLGSQTAQKPQEAAPSRQYNDSDF